MKKIFGLILLTAATLGLFARCGAGTKADDDVPATKKSVRGNSENARHEKDLDEGIPAASGHFGGTSGRKVREAFAQITTNEAGNRADKAAMQRVLEDLSRYLLEMPPREAGAAITERLESGEDARTGLDFEIGEEGLTGWPTWRVYLIDLLGSISPKAAADYARREIFTNHNSADEWAVAMRSLLAAAPNARQAAARGEISALLASMLALEKWTTAPTAGMFEAMDFVAHTPDPETHLKSLQVWATSPGGRGRVDAVLQMAAERSVTRQASLVLPKFAADSELLASSEAQRVLRASLMARADLRQAEQAQALRTYLARLPAGSPEAGAFFASFPNHRFGVAPGLAGLPVLPDAREMRAADTAAMRQVTAWADDPALSPHAASLRTLQLKLGRMLESE